MTQETSERPKSPATARTDHVQRRSHSETEAVSSSPMHGGNVQVEQPRRQQVRQRSTGNRENRRQPNPEELEEMEIKHTAGHVIQIFIPVSICMCIATIALKWFNLPSAPDKAQFTPYAPLKEDTGAGAGSNALTALGNAAIFAVFICCMTFVMYFLYKYKCNWVLYIWIAFTVVMILFTMSTIFIGNVVKHFNAPVDVFSMGLFLWNYGCLGTIAVLGPFGLKGPKTLNQIYLITIGVLMALIFITILPEWTTWTILAVISIWDLIAVLCKYGPLRMLVEEAQQRNDTEILGAIIYSAMAYEETTGEQQRSARLEAGTNEERVGLSGDESNQAQARSEPRRRLVMENDDEDDVGVKLGLGDFIFYSVLVGKAAVLGDWSVTFGCYIAILVGLSATLVCLAVLRRALPALPFSIALGLLAYFSGEYLLKPFLDEVTLQQIML